jgi:hypothetical protein
MVQGAEEITWGNLKKQAEEGGLEETFAFVAAKPASTGGGAGGACVAPPTGQLAWWPLDEASGPTAADLAGSNDGTHVGGPIPTAALVAGGLSFAGNGHVMVPNSPSFEFTDWTAHAWVNTTTISAYNRIISQQVGTQVNNASTSYWVVGLEDGKLSACSQPSDGSWETQGTGSSYWNSCITSAAFVADGQFHHVAVTRASGASIDLYVDGGLVMSVPIGSNPGYAIADDVFIGQASTDFGSSVQNFGGTLDEVSLYDRALSATEVAAIYNAGSGGFCQGPTTKDDCKGGGWDQYGFRNQGQCVRFIETGKDSR